MVAEWVGLGGLGPRHETRCNPAGMFGAIYWRPSTTALLLTHTALRQFALRRHISARHKDGLTSYNPSPRRKHTRY